MKAETLSPTRHDEWDRFVDSTPGGHVFLTSRWHRAWDLVPEVRILRDSAGAICAGLAFSVSRFLGRRAVRRPPFTPYNHPLLDEARLPRVTQQVEALAALMTDLTIFPVVDFVFRHDAPLAAPSFAHAGFQNDLCLTYVINAGEREHWRRNLSKNHRYSLRKAEEQLARDHWQISKTADPATTWSLLQATGENKGFRFEVKKEAFVRSICHLSEQQAGELWSLLDSSGQMLATALLVRDQRYAYFLASATHSQHRRSFLGNYLLLGSMIQDTLERSLSFDFEGSSLPGIEQFFRGWGGQIRHNVRQIRLSFPLSYAIWSIRRYWKSRRHAG